MDSWNKLPKDVQKVMEELGPQQAAWTGVYMDNHVKEAIAWSKKTHKVEFIELSGYEKGRWNGLLEPITNKWVSSATGKGLPAGALVNDIKAFAKMYSGE
jgi:TRAP-type C4-dicarboxylate transport system substrate-binding protein